MAKTTVGMPLEHSTRGDVISVGWRVAERRCYANRRPIAECIERLDRGKLLAVKAAFEMDANAWTGYDYLLGTAIRGPGNHAGGGFIQLECMEDGIKAVDLLQPVYNLNARLSHPRIWYDQSWFRACRGEYTIEEARAVLDRAISDMVFGCWNSHLAGTYYPSYDKILGVIKKLTTPEGQEDITGMVNMRRMIKFDSFCISTQPGRTNDGENWELAQEKMAARAILYMRDNPWTNTGWDRWLDISGPLDMPKPYASINELGMLDRTDRLKLFIHVLELLKTDHSIHLAKADMSAQSYLFYISGRDKPDEDRFRAAEVTL